MSEVGSSHTAKSRRRDVPGAEGFGPRSTEPVSGLPADPRAPPDDPTVITERGSDAAAGAVHITSNDAATLVGERLDHFDLIEFVGGGGMGAVFRARDTVLNREVALKVLSRSHGADDEMRRRFCNEAQSAARLDHENIARVYYFGEDRGLSYIVFEYIHGTNVRDLVAQKGVLSLSEALGITLQIAEALDHASRRDVVHRDIKPSNIIITEDGRAKLVDMGLARLDVLGAPSDELTASGVTLGTFDYISPEQARDPRNADVRSDIYSLGCTLYYMLTGRPPFPDGTVLQKLLSHQGEEPVDPRMYNPDVPEVVFQVLKRMLAKDPRQRFQNCDELSAALARVIELLGLSVGLRERRLLVGTSYTPAPWQRNLPWAVPVGLLVVCVILLELGFPWTQPAQTRLSDIGRNAAVDSAPVDNQDRNEGASATTEQTGVAPPGIGERTVPPGANAPVSPMPMGTANGGVADSDRVNPPSETKLPADAGIGPRSEGAPAGVQPGVSPTEIVAARPTETSRLGAPPFSGELALPSDTQGELRVDRIASSTSPTPGVTQDQLPAANNDPPKVSDPPPNAVAAQTAVDEGIVVVSASGVPRNYTSLAEACASAVDGETIELRFNGQRDEQPFPLANRHLVIVGGQNYQPTVRFRPSALSLTGYQSVMFAMTGGSLRLDGVHIEFEIPREARAETWSLFALQGVETLRIRRSTITVRNATDDFRSFHPSAAVFRVLAAPGANSTMMQPLPSPPPVEIRLEDTIVRGEAALLASDESQPARLVWENGLLAITEPAIEVTGGPQAAMDRGGLEVRLARVTAWLRNGLCRMTSSLDAPKLVGVQMECESSLLLANHEAPLVDQRGAGGRARLEQHFDWRGAKNEFYGFDVFWRMKELDAASTPAQLDFRAWQQTFNTMDANAPTSPLVRTQLTLQSQPTHRLSAVDFELAEPVQLRSTQRRAEGMQADRLPGVFLAP